MMLRRQEVSTSLLQRGRPGKQVCYLNQALSLIVGQLSGLADDRDSLMAALTFLTYLAPMDLAPGEVATQVHLLCRVVLNLAPCI